MPGEGECRDGLLEALLARARRAVEEARRQSGEAAELVDLSRALRSTGIAAIVRCAWCGRVAAGGHWIEAERLFPRGLPHALRETASHGICPPCFERVAAEAERSRRG